METGFEAHVERRAMLFQLVDRLPADQRLVVLRRFVEQKSTREIAQELGRSEGAVKQLQFRALQRLRSQILSRDVNAEMDDRSPDTEAKPKIIEDSHE